MNRSEPKSDGQAAAVAKLRAAGLRPTRQRVALAELLFFGPDRHVTAEQLHSEVLAADEKVSLATVYNTLNQFTRAGLLRELVVDAGRSYFDTNTHHHHHFFFEETGRLEDVAGENVRFDALPQAPRGTEISGVDIIIRLANRT